MFFKKQNALTRFILKYQIAVILTGSFILGAGTGKIVTRIEKLPKHVPSIASSSINSSSSAISSESTNWGLGFDEEGKRPTGNASIEQLKNIMLTMLKIQTQKFCILLSMPDMKTEIPQLF